MTKKTRKKLKTYRVGLYQESWGYATIKAISIEDAEEKAQELLDEEGIEGFSDFNPKDGQSSVVDCEEE